MRWWSGRFAANAAASAMVISLLVCGRAASQTSARPLASNLQKGRTPRNSAPDIFLITIDTLRADHVGCYGYKQVETPALDGIAADGVRFTQAFTHSPITNTSHITILTGLLPSVHGVTDFGVPLSPQHVTAAELLKKAGYKTAAFIGAVILDSNTLAPGLDRGFDFYDNFPKDDSKDADGKTKPRWDRIERRGMEVVKHAESWMDANRKGPHFVWVHLYDPHDPYEPPPPFAEKYKDHLYDGEIAYADSALAHWVAFLKKSGLYDSSIVIVTGDHGEGLGEHGEDTHGLFLYDSTLHIPLIVKLPGKGSTDISRGQVVESEVRTTDILPTILEAAKVAAPEELNGKSLLSLMEDTKKDKNNNENKDDRILFGETDYPLRWGWAPLRALRTPTAKLIEAPRPELYDLQADPGEVKNIYAIDSSRAQSMQSAMAEWKAKLPLNSANGKLPENLPDPPDPKDKVGVQNLLHNAMLANDDNRSADARRLLEQALQLDPSSPTAVRQLGELEFASGDFTKAAQHLTKAYELRPDDSTAAFELGEALEKSGNPQGARDALESSLKLAPSQMGARLLLGRVYLQLKDPKNAEDQFEAALLVDSNNTQGRLGLADAQIQQSNFAAAVPDLEALTKGEPQNAAAFRLLANAYRGLGKKEEAAGMDERATALAK
jgi:choline-sulfatase